MEILSQLVIIVALLAAGFYWLVVTNEAFLQAICEGISGSYHRGDGIGRRMYFFRGKFAGRNLRVEYRFRPFTRNRRQDELEIQIPVIQKFWMRLLTRSIPLPAEEESFGEQEVPAGPFLAHSNQPQAAREFLETPEILEQLAKLGPVTRLEIYRGTLKALYQKASDQLYRATFQDALEAIVRMIDAYERQLSFKLNAVPATESCPYCRGRLNLQTETIVECAQCITRVHQACWNENGHCTTWGCGSSTAQPC